jgi:cysteine desulfurase
MIYLDAAATTPTDPAVIEAMLPFLSTHFANPGAGYSAARVVRKALQTARVLVAELLGAETGEIVFTSGGTESINTALASARALWPEKPRLIITGTEHAATLAAAVRWGAAGGEVCRVPVNECGVVDLEALRQAARGGRTALVSIMWANNETGVIVPMREIVEIAHAAGALVHTDAVQAVGKVVVDVRDVAVDFLSLSGHKFHGPKGVGALFVSNRVRFRPLLVGGGQESDRRSGTENVPGIIGLGCAAALARHSLSSELRDAFERQIDSGWPEVVIHGHGVQRLPNVSSLCFQGLDAAGMLILLDKDNVACSAGSACHAASVHPSHVLEAMGYPAAHAGSTLRFSFSRFNTRDEIMRAAEITLSAARKLRSLGLSAAF